MDLGLRGQNVVEAFIIGVSGAFIGCYLAIVSLWLWNEIMERREKRKYRWPK